MKHPILLWTLLIVMVTLSSCDIVGGIFKAGIWVGIVLVVIVVALIFWLLNKFRR